MAPPPAPGMAPPSVPVRLPADPWALSSFPGVPEPVRPPSWLLYAPERCVSVTADDSVSQQGTPKVGPNDSVSQQSMLNVGPNGSVSQQCLERDLASCDLRDWQDLPQPMQPMPKSKAKGPALRTLQVTGSAAVQRWKRQRALGMNDAEMSA